MDDPSNPAPGNLVALDLSPFSKSDLARIKALGEKQRLLYRWFRSERVSQAGLDQYMIYSGDRSRTPYAAYRIDRLRDGEYRLFSIKTEECLATSRSLTDVLDKIPDDFFCSQ